MKKLFFWLDFPHEKLDFFVGVWLFAPIAIWFSFWPQISLGSSATMNFKITFSMFYLAVLTLASFIKIIQIFLGKPREIWRKFFAKSLAFWLVSAFVFLNGFSIFWSENFPRALATFALIFCFYLIFSALILMQNFIKKFILVFAKIYIFTAVIMSIFALAQFIYGTFFADGFLLCAGCVSAQFGFVRPNVFAIEPQFFGSLLLLAILLVFREILVKKNEFLRNILFGFFVVILILTLSRGAIFAGIFGGIFVLIFSRKSISKNDENFDKNNEKISAKNDKNFVKKSSQISEKNFAKNPKNFARNFEKISRKIYIKNFAKSIFIAIFSVVFALFLQGFSAEINPKIDTNFSAAINSSLNQLSLGIIKIRDDNSAQNFENNSQKIDENPRENSTKNSENNSQNSAQKTDEKSNENSEKIPAFSGYVARSTIERTSLSKTAFLTWNSAENPRKIFGFGLGSAGVAMANFAKNQGEKEIVQNEFVEVLLENGALGFAIFCAILVGLFCAIWRNKNAKNSRKNSENLREKFYGKNEKWLLGILAAFIFQWNFFSGIPSAIHVYLILILLYFFAKNMKEQKS